MFGDDGPTILELLENKAALISYNPDFPPSLEQLFNMVLAAPTQKMILTIKNDPPLLFWLPMGVVCIALSARWGVSVYSDGPVTVIEDIAAMMQFIIDTTKKE